MLAAAVFLPVAGLACSVLYSASALSRTVLTRQPHHFLRLACAARWVAADFTIFAPPHARPVRRCTVNDAHRASATAAAAAAGAATAASGGEQRVSHQQASGGTDTAAHSVVGHRWDTGVAIVPAAVRSCQGGAAAWCSACGVCVRQCPRRWTGGDFRSVSWGAACIRCGLPGADVGAWGAVRLYVHVHLRVHV